MSLQVLKKPLRVLPPMPQRPPQANIPQTLGEREYVRAAVSRYVEERRTALVPPLVLDELRTHDAAPIGLYFARLWYYEELYPLIFALHGLAMECPNSKECT